MNGIKRKKTEYSEGPIGEIRVVEDFLPPPDQLVFKDENVKVTIALSKNSVDFFKAEGRRQGVQYQRMIRNLLDAYVRQWSGKQQTPASR